MKKILISTFIFILIFSLNISTANASTKINYDLIYKETPILDFIYEESLDPQEDKDYQGLFLSPYTLIRTSYALQNKKIHLKPGYYLLKPATWAGYDFVLFKQKGKIKGVVPVYQKILINPEYTYRTPIKPEIPLYKKPFVFVQKIIAWPFKKVFKRRKPVLPPRSKFEAIEVDGNKYLEMKLYVEEYLYKILFKIES